MIALLFACSSTPPRAHAPASGAMREAPARGTERALRLPARAAGAPTGSEFTKRALRMSPPQRERATVDQILSGNVPDFERGLVAVELEATSPTGKLLRGRVFVVPDYLAVGSDEDFVRVPLTIKAARRIARETATILPTPHVVDAIHHAAAVKVSSPYLGSSGAMSSMQAFVKHHREIEERRSAAGAALGALLSGPKKDLVITKRMLSTPGHTPIYGWFGTDDTPIQELSLVHDDKYVDYAHGIRLVDDEMEVGGRMMRILDVLADEELAPLVSDEGDADLREVWARGW